MITTAPVSLATLEGTVRWRLMSVCLVLVRMEEHVLTLLMGTTATAQLTLRYCMRSTLPYLEIKFYTEQSITHNLAYTHLL